MPLTELLDVKSNIKTAVVNLSVVASEKDVGSNLSKHKIPTILRNVASIADAGMYYVECNCHLKYKGKCCCFVKCPLTPLRLMNFNFITCFIKTIK